MNGFTKGIHPIIYGEKRYQLQMIQLKLTLHTVCPELQQSRYAVFGVFSILVCELFLRRV